MPHNLGTWLDETVLDGKVTASRDTLSLDWIGVAEGKELVLMGGI